MPGVFKRVLLSLIVFGIALGVTACPGLVIDRIQITFAGGVAVVGATGTFTCLSPITGDIVSYRWSFGDGATAEGGTVTHAYTSSGDFLIECSILTTSEVLTFTKTIAIGGFTTLNVAAIGTGNGTVTGSGINCTIAAGSPSGDCTEIVNEGTVISLTANFDPGYAFATWTTCDLMIFNVCDMTLSVDKTATVSFIENFLGAAKQMSASSTVLPATITIDYVIENFSIVEDLDHLSALDDLTAIFGAHGVDWTFTSISSVPASLANPAFDGVLDTQLIKQAPPQTLLSGALTVITVQIELLTLDALLPSNQFCNQVIVTGMTSSFVTLSDESTDGLDPDPAGDGLPEENDPSCISF